QAGAADTPAEGLQKMRLPIVQYRMHGIQPQSIEVKLAQPVQRVRAEELPHRGAALGIEIDRSAPGRVVPLVEELWRVERQVVALRAEVVIDHIEQHHQPARVGGVNQRLEVLGPSVAGIRSKWQRA